MDKGYSIFLGPPCIDEYYYVERWPREGDKFLGRFSGNVYGGAIANAACVYAGLGEKTYIISLMGNSSTTNNLLQDLNKNKVDTSRMILKDNFADGKCVIFQSEKERTILVVQGDKKEIEVKEDLFDFLSGAKYIYSNLSGLETFKDSVHLFETLKKKGVKIVLDNEASTYVDDWRDYMKNVYIGFFNEYSLQRFENGRTEEEFLSELFNLGVQIVVETLGSEGCVVITHENRFAATVYDIDVVDTTGAGDTFNSSFMYGTSQGWPLDKTAEFATAAADMAIMKQGPRGGVTTKEKVFEFIKRNNKEIIIG